METFFILTNLPKSENLVFSGRFLEFQIALKKWIRNRFQYVFLEMHAHETFVFYLLINPLHKHKSGTCTVAGGINPLHKHKSSVVA